MGWFPFVDYLVRADIYKIVDVFVKTLPVLIGDVFSKTGDVVLRGGIAVKAHHIAHNIIKYHICFSVFMSDELPNACAGA